MPVKIGRFQPTSMERVEELRRGKVRRAGDPGMAELLDAVESGEPQEVPVEGEQTPKGMRIAIARAAGRRGLTVEMFESNDDRGNPVVIVVKSEPSVIPQQTTRANPTGNGRRKSRSKREDQGQAMDSYYERKVRGTRQTEAQVTNNYDEPRNADGMSETME